jgi:hypothetical protein
MSVAVRWWSWAGPVLLVTATFFGVAGTPSSADATASPALPTAASAPRLVAIQLFDGYNTAEALIDNDTDEKLKLVKSQRMEGSSYRILPSAWLHAHVTMAVKTDALTFFGPTGFQVVYDIGGTSYAVDMYASVPHFFDLGSHNEVKCTVSTPSPQYRAPSAYECSATVTPDWLDPVFRYRIYRTHI